MQSHHHNEFSNILSAGDFSARKFISPTGAELNVRYKAPASKGVGIIQMHHGAGEHSGRYLDFATRMSARGFHVFAHDHRGHGDTIIPGSPPHVFGVKGWDKVIEDGLAMGACIKHSLPQLPRIIAGHSMGSVIAFDTFLREPAAGDALLLSGPVFKKNAAMPLLRFLLKLEAMGKEPHAISALFQKLAWEPLNKPFEPARTAYDWLSRDELEVDKYVADPHCGWPPTINFAGELSKGLAGTFNDRRLKVLPPSLPVLMMSGRRDSSTANGTSVPEIEGRLQAAGLNNVTSYLYEDMRHELFNEKERELVYADVYNWCEKVVNA